MSVRPRFSHELETVELQLPVGKKLGSAIAVDFSPEEHLILLHMHDPPGVDVSQLEADDFLPDVAIFSADGVFLDAWGGPDHIPAIDGIQQWPLGREGLECDAEGNIWIFGYHEGDDAVLKFSQSGELLLQIGRRGKPGRDDDTRYLHGPTSCYHDVDAREVFVSDGYRNHRVISFNSDTGEYIRMWGAYGKNPSELSEEEGFGNPVHKVVKGPNGRLYVCDRIKNRVQEFEPTADGVGYCREVIIAPGTENWGAAFDLAFHPEGRFMYVNDGSNLRIWMVDLVSFEVVGWTTSYDQCEGEDNRARPYNVVHRFRQDKNGDLVLCCTGSGLKRLRFLGIS